MCSMGDMYGNTVASCGQEEPPVSIYAGNVQAGIILLEGQMVELKKKGTTR